MKTLQQFIETFYNGMVNATRPTGESFVKLADDLENREMYQDIIREVHEGQLPCDVIYSTIESVLGAMQDCLNDNEDLDELHEYVIDLEINNFMALNYVSVYFDNALQECEFQTFNALQDYAQTLFIEEIANLLKNEVESLEGEEWEHLED